MEIGLLNDHPMLVGVAITSKVHHQEKVLPRLSSNNLFKLQIDFRIQSLDCKQLPPVEESRSNLSEKPGEDQMRMVPKDKGRMKLL